MDLCCDQAPSSAFSPLNRDNPLNRDTLNRDTTVVVLVAYIHKSQKEPSPLTQFTITIENSNTTKYSTAVEKKERGKKARLKKYRGHFALLASFYAPYET